MTELKSTERLDRCEKTILVGVLLPDGGFNADDPLEEIRGLAKTAGLIVLGELLQKRKQVDMTTYIGVGKVDELKELVSAHEADLVVFDNDLGPAQTRNLEKALGVKVIDRTEVILNIFAGRALTHERIFKSSWRSLNTPCLGSSVCGRTFRVTKGGSACAVPAKSSLRKTAVWWGSGFKTSRQSS